MIASATKRAIVLSGMTIMTLLVAAFGCGRKSESRNQILDEIKAPEQTTLPNGGVVAPECVQIPEGISKLTIAETSAQISMNLDNVNEPSEIEFATFDLYGQRIFSERLCTTSPSSLLIELPAGAQRVDLFARNRTTGEVYSLEGIPASQGTRLNFGSMKPSKGAVFTGKVESENANALRGEILELGWSFGVEPNGDWSSGALPAGQWSLILSDGAGRRARFSKLPLGSNDVSIEAFALKETKSSFTPLWTGVLRNPRATFVAHSEQDVLEMRVSLDPTFVNSFWVPFQQIVTVPIVASGKQRVFVQYRTPDGTESPIMVSEFTAQILNLTNIATATVIDPVVSVEKPETTIVTTAPPDAVEHSVTVDVENLPRTWVSINTPLEIKLQPSSLFCGRRSLYVKFRDAQGGESESIQRTIDIRCWEKTLPQSPLEARYESGSVAINISTDELFPDDAVLIWGGRGRDKLFNDGAILKKNGDQWSWQKIADPPAELTPRTKPQLVVGKNYILVWGGEDLSGNAVAGWAFYDFRNNSWIAQSTTENGFTGALPPVLRNASAAYVNIMNNDMNQGSFLVIGGEERDSTPPGNISNNYYVMLEAAEGLAMYWFQFQAKIPIARATGGKSGHKSLFYLHSGITTPSGEPTTSKPDASGSAPELSGDLQTFAYYYDTTNAEYRFLNYIYKATDSRTAALEGHAFLHTRPLGSTSPTVAELFESQVFCIYGAQPYTKALPNVCKLAPFCRRLDDAYFFAPTGRLGLCFQPRGTVDTSSDVGYLKNYYLPMSSAPRARRLTPGSAAALSSTTQNSALFFWSGIAGGEYLSGGSIYFSGADRWVPITDLDAPVPRQHHIALHLASHNRVLIWGGLTTQGPTSEGAFYVLR